MSFLGGGSGAPQAPGGSRLADAVAVACLFASGFLALCFEILWIRKASGVFGATSFALSTVLAVFFGGLALGSWLFGRLSARSARPLRVYALLELGIGLAAIASPAAFRAADGLYGLLYPRVFADFALLSLLRLVGVSAILLPPTILMGGSLPLFCRHYVRRRERISRTVTFLYVVNTLGAALGCAICGLLLVRHVGVDRSLQLGGLACVAIAAVAFWLPLAPPAHGEAEGAASAAAAGPRPPAPSDSARRLLPALFFATGFVALALEVLWARYLTLLLDNTVYTYTLTLSVVLVGIVLGSALAARGADTSARRAFAFGAVQVANALVVLAVLALPPGFWRQWVDPQAARGLAAIALLLLPSAVLSGASFPLAIRIVVERPSRASRGVGRMAALNTAGGIAGSLAAGFLLLPLLGLQRGAQLVTGVSLLAGLAAWAAASEASRAWRGGLALAAALAWLGIPALSGTRVPQDFLGTPDALVAFREGLGSHLAVLRGSEGELRLEIDRMWQGENRRTHQVVAAHVPMILAPTPRRVLVIGLGPGQTASRFLLHPIEALDCVEIEHGLIELVRSHFDAAWMQDPRVRFVVEDGRSYLLHTEARYDVISVEIGQVFRPGLAAFYSVDFYRRARERLAPGGLVSQFVPLQFLTEPDFRTILRSFLEVFPGSVLWYNRSELLLLGSRDGAPRLAAERLALLAEDAIRSDLDFAYWGGPGERLNRIEPFLAGFLMGPDGLAALARGGRLYRDDRPHLEYTAGTPPPEVERRLVALLERHLEPVAPLLDEELRASVDAAAIAALRRDNLRDLPAHRFAEAGRRRLDAGDPSGAARLLWAALRWNPKNVRARVALAEALLAEGLPHTAVEITEEALRIAPDHAGARYGLGAAYLELGEAERAVAELRRLVEQEPEHALARLALGAALRAQGELAAARLRYLEALALDPDLAEAHARLGELLVSMGRADEAVSHLDAVLRLAPERWPLLNDAAWRLATHPDARLRRPALATQLALRAVTLSGARDAALLDTLAAAYAAAGRFDRALATAEEALEGARREGREALAREIAVRLASYRRGARAAAAP